jgi:hypothetical protein
MNNVSQPQSQNKSKFEKDYLEFNDKMQKMLDEMTTSYRANIATNVEIAPKTKRFMNQMIQMVAYHNRMIQSLYESAYETKILNKVKELEEKIIKNYDKQLEIYKTAEQNMTEKFKKLLETNPTAIRAIAGTSGVPANRPPKPQQLQLQS